MRHMRGLVVAVMGCVLIGSVAMGASSSPADFGFRGGYQRFTESDGSFLGGVFLRLPWHSVVMSEGAILYHSHSEGAVDLEVIPIQLSAMIFLLRRDLDFSPYILAGVGAYIARRVENGGDSDTDYDFGWHLGLGLDYTLNDRIFVEGDFRHVWQDFDFEGQTVGDKLSDFNNWMATAAIGFRL